MSTPPKSEPSHLTGPQLEALTVRWEEWESQATSPGRKIARARLHLVFLLVRYAGLRLGEALDLLVSAIDCATGMVRVEGSAPRSVLLPLVAMRAIRRIASLPEAAQPDFLHLDQGFVRKQFYSVAAPLSLPSALVGPRALRYSRGLELLRQHVPLPLVQKFLGQQNAAQLEAFLRFSDGEAGRVLRSQHSMPDNENIIVGIVSRLAVGLRMVEVEVTSFSGLRLVSLCPPPLAARLELHENQVVSVRILPEGISLAAGPERPQVSMANILAATVQAVHRDACETFVLLNLADGTPLHAAPESLPLGKWHLQEGRQVFALVSARQVTLLPE